ncbi:MAG: hypothetical protein DRP70_04020 [Spirochaetes bacterium]|nr:MAG: hypothetical protein DRP70_04020 [Spirochaetota bacterium]
MKSFVSLVLILLVSGALSAQAVLNDIRFIPPTFFVGDAVELRITFSHDGPLAVAPPDSIPESDWVDIKDVFLIQDDNTVTVVIAFTPFAPGTRTLPPMKLGALQLKDIKVPTHSIIENSHEGVRSLRGQLLMPGTRLAVALILSLAAMAPFLGYGLFRFSWKWVKKSRQLYRVGRPVRRLRRVIKKLKAGIGSMQAPLWYYELTEALRAYLSDRSHHDCRSATTAEIALMSEFLVDDTPQKDLLEILKEGDMVKFAGRFADDRSLNKTLEMVTSAVGKWEKADAQLQ